MLWTKIELHFFPCFFNRLLYFRRLRFEIIFAFLSDLDYTTILLGWIQFYLCLLLAYLEHASILARLTDDFYQLSAVGWLGLVDYYIRAFVSPPGKGRKVESVFCLEVNKLENNWFIAFFVDFKSEENWFFIMFYYFLSILKDLFIRLFILILHLHLNLQLVSHVILFKIADNNILKIIIQFRVINPYTRLIMFVKMRL